MLKSVDEIGHRLTMHRALEEETRIRCELERLCGEPVELGVHHRLRTFTQSDSQLIDSYIAAPPGRATGTVDLVRNCRK
jgi:hypothetical protein